METKNSVNAIAPRRYHYRADGAEHVMRENVVTFLLSPQSRHITGQALVVDGGWTSVSPES